MTRISLWKFGFGYQALILSMFAFYFFKSVQSTSPVVVLHEKIRYADQENEK